MLFHTLLPFFMGPALGSAAALASTTPNDKVGADGVAVFPLADEPDFAPGFLIPSKIPLEEYANATDLMVPVGSIIDDGWDLELPDGSLFDGNLEAFDEDGNPLASRRARETKVLVGRTLVDYGCDASIRKPLAEAIHGLCRNGLCDGGTAYTRTVKHMDRSPIRNSQLSITIVGRYVGRHTRGYVANVVENLVTPKTAPSAWREYFLQIGGGNIQHYGCSMSKFGNYIRVVKDWGEQVDIEIRISLNQSNQYCIGQNVFREALSLVNSYASAFFSTFVPNCD
ncbi:hypothetical protein B0T11DRAFT_333415 [Plectosphaerella cucumerina]|uniref:Uncharacterized protein n=1 Tax=Plectosphaerella cucumerina TaxID=40658 RepID=A0A8K0WXP2_9PEZI|nr:hypothetical protein B0T11DRAFT_333415 [Plectosphaerella cucumerina]